MKLPQPSQRDQAIIRLIIDHYKSTLRLGKKAMQKLVYLVNEISGVKSSYDFKFYTYGVYSTRLMNDLDVLRSFGALNISYDASNDSYNISGGEKFSFLEDPTQTLSNTQIEEIKEILDKLRGSSGRYLELITTIIFACKDAPSLWSDQDTLVDRVKALKPKYSNAEIREGIVKSNSLIVGRPQSVK